MNNEQIAALIENLRAGFAGDIKEGDSNPDKWYELFLYSEEEGSESFESADTFDEIVTHLPHYINHYPDQKVGIDLWVNRENPSPLCVDFIPAKLDIREDVLSISNEIDEVIEVQLDPEKHPDTFARKVRCLQKSGLTKEEAEADVMKTPIQLSLFYSLGQGLFAVESEAVDCTPIHNPYDGREIPNLEDDE